jgi:hypothetical protein
MEDALIQKIGSCAENLISGDLDARTNLLLNYRKSRAMEYWTMGCYSDAGWECHLTDEGRRLLAKLRRMGDDWVNAPEVKRLCDPCASLATL